MNYRKIDEKSLKGLINLLGRGTVKHSFIYNLLGITIDGTDISGVTVDGADVQEITVDGDSVWKATTLIDDYEGVLSPAYEGDTDVFQSGSSNQVYNGTGSLESSATNSSAVRADSGDYAKVSRPCTFTYWTYVTTTDRDIAVAFNYSTDSYNGYCATWRSSDRRDGEDLFLARLDGESRDYAGDKPNWIDSVQNTEKPTNEWIKWKVEMLENGTINVNVYDVYSNLLYSLSGVDTNYSKGGIGLYSNAGGSGTQYYDYLRVK